MEFLLNNIWLILAALISGVALFLPLVRGRGVSITALRATQLINQSDAVVIDVREPEAFAAGHLTNAKNVPLKELDQRAADLAKQKDKPVVTICDSGRQSIKAASKLRKAGITQVFSLDGGYKGWVAGGLPTTK